MSLFPKVNTHACQARYRAGCIWHALPGTDLCRPCANAERDGEYVPRIARPCFDRDGERINYAGAATDLVRNLMSRLRGKAPTSDVGAEEIPF